MKKNLFLSVLVLLSLTYCGEEKAEQVVTNNTTIEVKYPETKMMEHVDTYHGTEIKDPFHWLEDDNAEETKSWVNAENAVTNDYLAQIPFRKAIEERLTELINYPRLSSPFKVGDYYFFNKNDGLQNQSVIYYQKGLEGEPMVFIDPNALAEDGTVSINLVGFSKDDKYAAFSRSEAGSDWSKMYVMEIETRKQLPDVLEWVKFSGASWHDGGFYYSRYPAPEAGEEFSGNNQFHSVYYHKLGEEQLADKLIYRDDENPDYYHFCGITEDSKYLLLYAQPGTNGYAQYYKSLEKEDDFKLLFPGYDNKSAVVHHVNGKFLARTDVDAPNYRLIEVDPENPAKENWKDIIPETENLLQAVNTGGGKLFANYLKNATDFFYQYEYDGTGKKEIKLPGLGSAGGFGGEEDDEILFYSFTSFTYPNTIFKYNIQTGKSEQFYKADLKFNPADYVEKQVFYKSKDGTDVSMFIVHKKGLKMDGQNPTYLYGYGGFNISLTPYFSSIRMVLLENNGVYVMTNLRGGGEYGEEWHKGGMLLNKQNVFDDFIGAAEHLIEEGYTSKEKLAIAGGSNGGLLVGAAMTQRPDLFAVALPAVGVMDMLRYHLFTVGKGWIPEYGSSDEKEHFDNLLSFSPLHNLKDGVEYPATMITTADHDDRVVPAHSFKFAARLQQAHKGDNPVLIRIEKKAGHGAGKPIAKVIEEQADIWSFLFYNTNSPVKYLED